MSNVQVETQRQTRTQEGLALTWDSVPGAIRYGFIVGFADLPVPPVDVIMKGVTRDFAILGVPAKYSGAVDLGSPVGEERQYGLVAYRSDGSIVSVPGVRFTGARSAPRDREYHSLLPPELVRSQPVAPAAPAAPPVAAPASTGAAPADPWAALQELEAQRAALEAQRAAFEAQRAAMAAPPTPVTPVDPWDALGTAEDETVAAAPAASVENVEPPIVRATPTEPVFAQAAAAEPVPASTPASAADDPWDVLNILSANGVAYDEGTVDEGTVDEGTVLAGRTMADELVPVEENSAGGVADIDETPLVTPDVLVVPDALAVPDTVVAPVPVADDTFVSQPMPASGAPSTIPVQPEEPEEPVVAVGLDEPEEPGVAAMADEIPAAAVHDVAPHAEPEGAEVEPEGAYAGSIADVDTPARDFGDTATPASPVEDHEYAAMAAPIVPSAGVDTPAPVPVTVERDVLPTAVVETPEVASVVMETPEVVLAAAEAQTLEFTASARSLEPSVSEDRVQSPGVAEHVQPIASETAVEPPVSGSEEPSAATAAAEWAIPATTEEHDAAPPADTAPADAAPFGAMVSADVGPDAGAHSAPAEEAEEAPPRADLPVTGPDDDEGALLRLAPELPVVAPESLGSTAEAETVDMRGVLELSEVSPQTTSSVGPEFAPPDMEIAASAQPDAPAPVDTRPDEAAVTHAPDMPAVADPWEELVAAVDASDSVPVVEEPVAAAAPGYADDALFAPDVDVAAAAAPAQPDPLALPAPEPVFGGTAGTDGTAADAAAESGAPEAESGVGGFSYWTDDGDTDAYRELAALLEPGVTSQPPAQESPATTVQPAFEPAAAPLDPQTTASVAALLDEAELYLLPSWLDYGEAARLVGQAAALAPADPRVIDLQQKIAQAQGDGGGDTGVLLREAEQALDAGDHWRAVDLYEQALARESANDDARQGLERARLYGRWGAQRAAAEVDPARLRELGDQFATAAPELAAQAYADAFDLDPSVATLRGWLLALARSGGTERVVETARRGVQALRLDNKIATGEAQERALAALQTATGQEALTEAIAQLADAL